MTQAQIVIRCDASLSIGSGHVIRCRTLARALQQRGAKVLFLCRRQPGDLITLLEKEFQVLTLTAQKLSNCSGLEGRKLYEAWLGCTLEKDAHDCLRALSFAEVHEPDWLVVDHYGLDARWQKKLRNNLLKGNPARLLVIDDLADRAHEADILLDQNFFGEGSEQRYQKLVPNHCRELFGPHYALLGPEYSQLHPLVPSRKNVRRILVYFGGVDKDNLTGRTLEALMDPAMAHLAVDVVLGRQSPHHRAVSELVEQRAFTTLHTPLPSLAGLISRADLAIGAAGTTTWERACLKLPTLVVTIASNQKPFAEALDQAGHLRLIGDAKKVSTEQIQANILHHINSSVHQKMGAGESLTDGHGASRLAIAMLGPQSSIKLRKAEDSDESILLRWANDPQVRANSFSQEPITASDHHNWFRGSRANHNRLLLIASTEDNIPIGQIRFDRQPMAANQKVHEAMIDLSIDRCARGYRLAEDVLRLGLQAMKQHWGPDIAAVAEVFTTNNASNTCFKRANFTKEPFSTLVPPDKSINRWRKA